MIRRKRLLGVLLATAAAAIAAENPVLDWNNTAITTALAASQVTAPDSNSQPGSILYLAYVHLAIYDAVNAIDLRFTFHGPPIPAPASASVHAAVIEAAYRMLFYLFPDQAPNLITQYNASLASIKQMQSCSPAVVRIFVMRASKQRTWKRAIA
jgi:hypothetical protein